MRLTRAWGRSAEIYCGIRHRLPVLITLVGILATFLAVFVEAGGRSVYSARVQVWFITPTSADNPNGLEITPDSLVMTAGAVRRMVIDTDPPRTSSPYVPLAGEGVRQGYSVTLPNTGGQWINQFANPYLDVQAVGPSAASVLATERRLVSDINAALSTLERQQHVAPVNRIRTQLNPLTGIPVGAQRGSRIRAVLATLALGAGLTYAARRYASNGLRARARQEARNMSSTSWRWARANIE